MQVISPGVCRQLIKTGVKLECPQGFSDQTIINITLEDLSTSAFPGFRCIRTAHFVPVDVRYTHLVALSTEPEEQAESLMCFPQKKDSNSSLHFSVNHLTPLCLSAVSNAIMPSWISSHPWRLSNNTRRTATKPCL